MSKISDDIESLNTNLATNTRVRISLLNVRGFVEAIEASDASKFQNMRDVQPRVVADVVRLWDYYNANGDILPTA